MEVTPQIAVCVLLILPGLVGHAVFSAYTFTARPSWSERVLVAITVSVSAYLTLACARQVSWLGWIPDPLDLLRIAESGKLSGFAVSSMVCVLLGCLLAVAYAIPLVLGHNYRVLHRLGQSFGLTTKSGFDSEWDSVITLRARSRWVMVLLKDGTAFTGWLESHDVASDGRAMVFSKVREYDKDGANFEWSPDELLFLNDLSDVRALRLIPVKELIHAQNDNQSSSAPHED